MELSLGYHVLINITKSIYLLFIQKKDTSLYIRRTRTKKGTLVKSVLYNNSKADMLPVSNSKVL
eukprot:snap_masked-scaffold_29-processed-gene-2.60-mRNA-1 protein AED:1.00 eAED:1.00 QI:0/0/0/0/1/1/2/0/63